MFEILIPVLEFEPGAVPWPALHAFPSTASFEAKNGYLKTLLSKVETDFGDLGVAVVDFNPPAGGDPVLYAWRSGGFFTIGSLGKIAILYAAFQLRQDVRDANRNKAARDLAAVKANLLAYWKALTNPWCDYIRTQRAPRLEGIFDLSGLPDADKIDFLGMAPKIGMDSGEKLDKLPLPAYTPAPSLGHRPEEKAANVVTLKALGVNLPGDFSGPKEKLIPAIELLENLPDNSVEKWNHLAKLDFAPRLWMTTVWSDNCAATTCASDIGLSYVQALMRSSSLDQADAGLTLREAYESPAGGSTTPYVYDKLPPTDVSHQSLYLDLQARNPKAPPISKQSGRPKNLARYMIALAQGAMPSSDEMIRFLRPIPGWAFGSWMLSALGGSSAMTDSWCKIGIAASDWLNDWVFIQQGGHKWGFVALGAREKSRFTDLANELKTALHL